MDNIKTARSLRLIDAIVRGQLSRVKILLENGADVNFVNISESNNTPLHYAYSANAKEIAELLISRGAHENVKNTNEKLPLELGDLDKPTLKQQQDSTKINFESSPILDKLPEKAQRKVSEFHGEEAGVMKYFVERSLLLYPIGVDIVKDRDLFVAFGGQHFKNDGDDRDLILLYGFGKLSSEKYFHFDRVIGNCSNAEIEILKKCSYLDTVEQYQVLCQENRGRNVHLLEIDVSSEDSQIHFLWHKSQGSLDKLRKHKEENAVEIALNTKIDMRNNVVVLAAEPGMGKTTIMTALFVKNVEKNPSDCIVKLNLRDYSNQLNKLQQKNILITKYDALDFLTNVQETNCKANDRLLFQELCHQHKIIILIDGFNEVSPDYEDIIKQLLHLFRDNFAKTLWVATRPGHVQARLEDSLAVFACTLKPFTEDDSKQFLRKYWCVQLKLEHVDDARFNIFAVELLKQFSHSIDQRGIEFMSVPLQSKMIAMVFQNAFHEFYQSGNDKLFGNMDLIVLFEQFVEIKYNIYREQTNVENNSNRQKHFQDFIKMHELVAIHALLNESSKKLLLSTQERELVFGFIERGRKSEETTEIIYNVNGEKPLFVHQTYAEYFAALLLFEKFASLDSEEYDAFVKKVVLGDLLKNNKIQISKFLALKVKKCIDLVSNTSNKASGLLSSVLDIFKDFSHISFEHVLKIVDHLIAVNTENLAIENMLRSKPESTRLALLGISSEIGCTQLARVAIQSGKKVPETHSELTALHRASQNGHLEIVTMLLENGSEVNAQCTAMSYTPLHLAAENGYLEVVTLLLDHGANVEITTTGDYIKTALHMASANGHLKVVETLVKNGAKMSSFSDFGSVNYTYLPALHWATKNGHENVVNFLLEKGASVNAKTDDGRTALYVASSEGKLAVVKLLLNYGANDARETTHGYFSLHIASKNGHYDVVNYLLYCGANINAVSETNDLTPLYLASLHGKTKIVGMLLAKGADVNACSSTGYTALHVAAQNGYDEIVALLLKQGANLNCTTQDKCWTPLYTASFYGKTKVVEMLLETRADLEIYSNDNYTALHVAVEKENDEIVTLLLRHGANINAPTSDNKWTPLFLATIFCNPKAVAMLLAGGADVHSDLTCSGYTVLHGAAQAGNSDAIPLLLKHGVDINGTTKTKGWTPLYQATSYGKTNVVRMLLDLGADAYIYASNDYTALHCAAEHGNEEIIDVLLKHGVNINLPTRDKGWTPLFVAAIRSNTKVVEMLLERGADVCNLSTGYTALHGAAEDGNADIIALLLKYGANINAFTKVNGWTPLFVASINGNTRAVEKLLEKGANVNSCMTSTGYTALHGAAQEGYDSIVALLLKHDAKVDAVTKEEELTPLYLASLHGKTKVVAMLLEKGANTNICAPSGYSALHGAAQNGHNDVILLLLQHGTNIHIITKEQQFTPVYFASLYGQKKTVEMLLDKGANLHKCSNNGFTTLHGAAFSGNDSLVAFLLAQGVNINGTTKDKNWTPLYWASMQGKTKVIEILLKRGADLHIHCITGFKPFHIAAKKGYRDVVMLLLKHGENVNVTVTANGRTALHLATENGHQNVVQILLEKGANIDLCTNDNAFTPLHLAAQNGHTKIAETLINYGSSVAATTTNNGETPLYLASVNSNFDIVELLKKHGATY